MPYSIKPHCKQCHKIMNVTFNDALNLHFGWLLKQNYVCENLYAFKPWIYTYCVKNVCACDPKGSVTYIYIYI